MALKLKPLQQEELDDFKKDLTNLVTNIKFHKKQDAFTRAIGKKKQTTHIYFRNFTLSFLIW